ncbi:hypothetical protein HNP46_000117 [Pseudomonas nitritireducens]|uniref:DNA-binding protein n=1 Tax=Pseudomonas nitroreducens TaxID=46680 RepID=A0A7W7NYC2_PSENT|nr:hypothetical protein [Pseudomonas nitritireducens]MBB4861306.1 hypothetical protein [Pseudomonas nitritireducens]
MLTRALQLELLKNKRANIEHQIGLLNAELRQIENSITEIELYRSKVQRVADQVIALLEDNDLPVNDFLKALLPPKPENRPKHVYFNTAKLVYVNPFTHETLVITSANRSQLETWERHYGKAKVRGWIRPA